MYPISMGFTEFHTMLAAGLDSRSLIRSLQKGAGGKSQLLYDVTAAVFDCEIRQIKIILL